MIERWCPAPTIMAGTRRHGFHVLRVEEIHCIRATAYELEHEKTGARVLHLHCNDRENLYSVGFRTPPTDSTGVAHILEHCVLAGSEKYPVKDAFNELAKGTLQTFINAFTYPDKTIYPVASQIRKDFFNLARVYTDLVLRPRLLKQTFEQEGHHLEFLNPDDPESELIVSGIVYNEMKGVYSSPDSLMWKAIQEGLYPDTVYAFDSGGHPEVIPFLTYEQLCDVHQRFYSPTNARFFIYGDIPTEDHMAFLGEMLAGFDRISVESRIDIQKRWEKPVRVSGTYPIGEGEDMQKKTAVNLAWMLADNRDYETVLLLEIVSRAFIGSAAGPLRKALIDSRLGEDLSPVTGLDCDLRQIAFAVGLRGTDRDKAEEIEALVIRTLQDIAERGFDQDIIEGALHQIEFRGREIVRRAYPYAITLLGRLYRTWLYDEDPLVGLRLPDIMDGIRIKWQSEPKLFNNLVRTWFVENPHRILSIMEPSRAHAEEWEETFRNMMRHARCRLTQKERDEIQNEAVNLRRMQQEPDSEEALATIPRLTVKEIPREADRIPTERTTIGGAQVYQHDIFTNNIAYMDLAFDVSDVGEDLQPLLPVLGKLTTGMGAGGMDYEEVAKRLALKTGGLSYHLASGLTVDGRDCWQKLVFSIQALYRHLPEALNMIADVLCEGDLADEIRMRDLIFEKRNRLHATVIPSGHLFARRTAAKRLSLPAYRDEQWHGRTQLIELHRMSESFGEERESLTGKLWKLREHLFRRKRVVVNVTADEKIFPMLSEGVGELIRRLPGGGKPGLYDSRIQGSAGIGVAIPAQVCYVARVFPAPSYSDPLTPSLMVLSRQMSSGYLYNRIRVQGGAYGGMSLYDPLNGHFSFLSYRDPHLVKTLEIYHEAVTSVVKERISAEDLEKAIIGTAGALDRPMDPSTKGYTAMIREFTGLTDDKRQRFRDRLFETSAASVQEAAQRYLAEAFERSTVAVYASDARLRDANKVIRPSLILEPLISPP